MMYSDKDSERDTHTSIVGIVGIILILILIFLKNIPKTVSFGKVSIMNMKPKV